MKKGHVIWVSTIIIILCAAQIYLKANDSSLTEIFSPENAGTLSILSKLRGEKPENTHAPVKLNLCSPKDGFCLCKNCSGSLVENKSECAGKIASREDMVKFVEILYGTNVKSLVDATDGKVDNVHFAQLGDARRNGKILQKIGLNDDNKILYKIRTEDGTTANLGKDSFSYLEPEGGRYLCIEENL